MELLQTGGDGKGPQSATQVYFLTKYFQKYISIILIFPYSSQILHNFIFFLFLRKKMKMKINKKN